MANVYTRSVFKLREDGIFMTPDLLGTTNSVTFKGHRVDLTFPDSNEAFHDDQYPEAAKRQMAFGLHPNMAQEIRVDVFFDDVELGPSLEGQGPVCFEGRRLAGEFVTAFVGQVRVHLNHDWLGTSIDEPELVTGATSLFNADSGERYTVSHAEFPGCVHNVEHLDLSTELLDDILAHLAADEDPPLSYSLLFDARYMARVRRPPDLRLAVLLAAIAVEMETRQALEIVCPEDSRPLLDVLFSNPRDYTMAAVSHLDKTAKAVCGRSLREEDRPLYNRADKLFQVRNAIAHGKGSAPSDSEMWDAVNAGMSVYGWLLGLTGGV